MGMWFCIFTIGLLFAMYAGASVLLDAMPTGEEE